MFLIIFVTLFACLLTWYQLRYRQRNLLLARIPAPRKYPLIHNTLEFLGKSPKEIFDWLVEMNSKLGPVYHFTYEPFDDSTFIVSDVKVVEAILSSQKQLNKGFDYDLMKAWLGTGLLTSSGQKWHQRRKIITPAFHFQILEKFVEIMDEQGKILIEKLAAFDGREVNIYPLVNLYTLDVICESAMGCKINAQNEDSDYVRAVKEIADIIYLRSFDTFRRNDFIYRFTEMCRREKATLKILHAFTDSVIKARRKELLCNDNISDDSFDSTGSKRKKALLDLLLMATVDGAPLTDLDIREEVDTFMFEGHDTTTSGISFCLYNLAKYPDIQQRVLKEICSEIDGSEADDGVLSQQHLNKFRYLELVIKESLRLYPSVPYFARRLSEEITAGGYTLPKNCSVYVAPYLMGRDASIFPDPLVFNPDRFDVVTTCEKVNPYGYVPFSAGPRNCVGQRFALYELKSIVAKIVRHFELSLAPDNENLAIYSDLVLKTTSGIVLNVKRRISNAASA